MADLSKPVLCLIGLAGFIVWLTVEWRGERMWAWLKAEWRSPYHPLYPFKPDKRGGENGPEPVHLRPEPTPAPPDPLLQEEMVVLGLVKRGLIEVVDGHVRRVECKPAEFKPQPMISGPYGPEPAGCRVGGYRPTSPHPIDSANLKPPKSDTAVVPPTTLEHVDGKPMYTSVGFLGAP